MPYLESVEFGMERAAEMVEDVNAEDTLDPTLAQENYDCNDIGTTDHPSFTFKDPSDMHDEPQSRSIFKSLGLYDDDTMLNMSRSLRLFD